jgi:hypothetical protein
MKSGEPGDPYYRAVEEEFVRRRGAAMLLSPRDWSLIGEWKEAGVPLRVVLQAIDNIFDAFERRAPRGRRINSLSYCRQEVLALDELYRTLHAVEAGRPRAPEDAAAVAAAAGHLGRLGRRVRAAMAPASQAGRDPLVASLARVAAELKGLRREIKSGVLAPHLLEERLRQFDEELLAALRASLRPEEMSPLEEAAHRALGRAAERMTREARDRTRRARLARLLRESAALPRLTLFDA